MRIRPFLILTAMLGLIAPVASADVISFSETIVGSGTLGVGGNSTSFVGSTVTLTVTVDNSSPTQSMTDPKNYTLAGTVSIDISGGNLTSDLTDSLSGKTGVYVEQAGSGASTGGIYDNNTANAVVIGTTSSSFDSYIFGATTAPIVGANFFYGPYIFTTDGGLKFEIDTVPSGTSTFTAISLAAVPEPSSLVLTALAFAFGGLGYARRKRLAAKV